ncbi:hypothetical protein DB345_21170 [Spartobacteria bacterium LR76]|nr:hypothetical protein DB345_21170 [Spartobacteria bacterium LR76]
MRTALSALFIATIALTGNSQLVELPKPPGLTRAAVYFSVTPDSTPRAVLVFCPGMNGDGSSMVQREEWKQFARDNNLALAGLCFSSEPRDLDNDKGYTSVEIGSGQTLLTAIDSQTQRKDIPLILVGFSSGAYFVRNMAGWCPDRISTWIAWGSSFDSRMTTRLSPGLIVCGDKDYTRWGGAFLRFKRDRSTGSPVLWLSLAGKGHQWADEVVPFLRQYIKACLDRDGSGCWVDVETKSPLTPAIAKAQPALSGWMPDASLVPTWEQLHTP